MPPDTTNYTDLLMAPAFTGETMDAAEYEATVAAAYGKTLAADLGKSVFTMTINCPAPITRTTASKPAKIEAKGSIAVIKIPLSGLLSMNEPLSASAEWQ